MIKELQGLATEMAGLRKELKPLSSSASTININAGGIGVWIATASCAVMLGIAIIGSSVLIDQNRRIGELQAYLSAIYSQAPYLKPETEQ